MHNEIMIFIRKWTELANIIWNEVTQAVCWGANTGDKRFKQRWEQRMEVKQGLQQSN